MPSRRTFLKQSAVGVVGASSLATSDASGGAISAAEAKPAAIPRHRAVTVPGIHAYAEKSVAAGETVHFRVSSTLPYQLTVTRLGSKVDDPTADEVVHVFSRVNSAAQAIHVGSYIHVPSGLSAQDIAAGLSLECWVRPWRLTGRQGIFTQVDEAGAAGLGLMLLEKGKVGFRLEAEGARAVKSTHVAGRLRLKKWHHLVATWDGRTRSLWIDGKLAGTWPFAHKPAVPTGPLRLGALADADGATDFLDGDLAMPAIYGRALSATEIGERYAARGLKPPPTENLLAFWPLDEERGERVRDTSSAARHGQLINHGTWMIGGPSFDAAAVPRYEAYDPAQDESRGHAIRLAADDLYDCRWSTTQELALPENAKPGIYVGRFRYDLGGTPSEYHVTFVVRCAPSRPKAKMLVLCAANTWTAYSSSAFAANTLPRRAWHPSGLENSPGAPPAYSFYRDHAAGQPAYQVGLNMPWPVAGPDVFYSPPAVGYSHLMRSERFLHGWLEQHGIAYDVAADLDLDRDPRLLKGYQAVVIAGHSEYWSRAGYKAIEEHLRGGGDVVMLSGNTMYWRVSFDARLGVMECRKYDPPIGGSPSATFGELWHSHDGKRGCLMRECDLPEWRLLGLECIGWWGLGTEIEHGVFCTTHADHFLFHKPSEVGLGVGETFGHSVDGHTVRAVGHECDVRLSTLAKLSVGPPPKGAAMPEEPPGITTLAHGVRDTIGWNATFDYFSRPAEVRNNVFSEVIYWERPEGGRVFAAGAISAGWALSVDKKFERLMLNVLDHFGVGPEKG